VLLTFLGTPSPLTAALLKVMQAVAETAVGPYHWIAAGTPEELQEAWATRGDKPVLLFSDIPSIKITEMLKASGAPIVVVLEPPAAIVRAVATTRKITGLPALRFASQSLATLHDVAFLETAWRIGTGAADMPLVTAAEMMARHFRLRLDAPQVDNVLKALKQKPGSGATVATLVRKHEDLPSPSTASDMALAARVLGGFDDLLAGIPARRFEWEPEIFLGDKPHGEPITGRIELIGGKRCFLFGPFFHLPAGAWRVAVDFDIADNVSGNLLKIDVHTDRVIEEGTVRLPNAGRFACSLDFAIEEPRLPVQIRLFVDEGAIEGRFELHGMTVERVA
jgi:hypothetical protein